VDFNDLLLVAARVLSDHPPVAATLRHRHRYLLVDEYQAGLSHQCLLQWGLNGGSTLCVYITTLRLIIAFDHLQQCLPSHPPRLLTLVS